MAALFQRRVGAQEVSNVRIDRFQLMALVLQRKRPPPLPALPGRVFSSEPSNDDSSAEDEQPDPLGSTTEPDAP